MVKLFGFVFLLFAMPFSASSQNISYLNARSVAPYGNHQGLHPSANESIYKLNNEAGPTAFHTDEIFVAPSYFYFADKDEKFGTYGGSLEYTHWTSDKLGLTLDLGYYTRSKKEDNSKQNNNIFTITAGVTYIPGLFGKDSKFDLYTHGLIGMVNYKTKVDISGVGESKLSKGGFTFNLGAALNYAINNKMDWRILQADYIPTFFFNNTQNNFRLSTGLTFKWGISQ